MIPDGDAMILEAQRAARPRAKLFQVCLAGLEKGCNALDPGPESPNLAFLVFALSSSGAYAGAGHTLIVSKLSTTFSIP